MKQYYYKNTIYSIEYSLFMVDEMIFFHSLKIVLNECEKSDKTNDKCNFDY